MEKILETYLADVLLLSKPYVKYINPNYPYNNNILFTYTHEHNYDNKDIKYELNIWDLLTYTFHKIK